MTDCMDVVSFKKTQSGKTFAVRLGSATPNKDGNGWNLWLDAMPAAVEGQFRLSVVPPRDNKQGGNGGQGGGSGLDDEVPY